MNGDQGRGPKRGDERKMEEVERRVSEVKPARKSVIENLRVKESCNNVDNEGSGREVRR